VSGSGLLVDNCRSAGAGPYMESPVATVCLSPPRVSRLPSAFSWGFFSREHYIMSAHYGTQRVFPSFQTFDIFRSVNLPSFFPCTAVESHNAHYVKFTDQDCIFPWGSRLQPKNAPTPPPSERDQRFREFRSFRRLQDLRSFRRSHDGCSFFFRC